MGVDAAVNGGEYRAKPGPSEPNRFVADVDTLLMQQVFDIAPRKWKANVHQDRQTNDLRAGFEVAVWRADYHPEMSRNRPARLKTIFV